MSREHFVNDFAQLGSAVEKQLIFVVDGLPHFLESCCLDRDRRILHLSAFILDVERMASRDLEGEDITDSTDSGSSFELFASLGYDLSGKVATW